ncbi:MAG: hypothetical protein RR372_00145 [Oscillospiraceae bacterium]
MQGFVGMTLLYSTAHLLVDFSCAFILFSKIGGEPSWVICLLIYNFCAFALQLPLGWLSDRLNKNRHFAALGCCLVAISPLFGGLPILLSGLAGLGNGLFHIGGGRDVLCGSRGKFTALGVFVSPGAIGLYIGTLLGKASPFPAFFVSLMLLFTAVLIFALVPRLYDEKVMEYPAFSMSVQGGGLALFALLCLFAVVCLRSYVGMTLAFPWKGEGSFSLLLLLALAFGKALGGFFADRFGAGRVSFITLFLCAGLFFFYKIPACGILAVFLFNMTMPITLGGVALLLPGAKGLGFGLLTFGLFLGFLPIIMGVPRLLTLPWGFVLASIFSALLLFVGLRKAKNGN